MNKLTDQMKRELERLALLRDDEINTQDLPEETVWKSGVRSSFYKKPIALRNYDIRSIANWFIRRMAPTANPVTNLSLNKLVYFAIERSLIERTVLLSPAKIEAWAHGPVIREIYHAFRDKGNEPIREEIRRFSIASRGMEPAHDAIQDSDLQFLIEIAGTYGCLTASQLRNLSHGEGQPWSVVWNAGGNVNPGMEITSSIIEEHAPKRRQFDGQY